MKKAKANEDIRLFMRMHSITQFDVATEWGVSEGTIFRRLRGELTPEDKELFMKAIDKIIKERG